MIIRHSPKKGVGSVVIDFAFRVFPVQTLPGGLLHHTGFQMRALIRTARFEWAVADLFGCGALAGGVDRGHAASFRLGLGHGFTDHPPSVLSMILCLSVGAAPAHNHPRQPLPSDCQHPGMVGENYERY